MGIIDRQSDAASSAAHAPASPDSGARTGADEALPAQAPETRPPLLLDEAERHRVLVEWNATEAHYPQDKCVHEFFEAQAAGRRKRSRS
jgi:non-ribosomal peptide synthetase component F